MMRIWIFMVLTISLTLSVACSQATDRVTPNASPKTQSTPMSTKTPRPVLATPTSTPSRLRLLIPGDVIALVRNHLHSFTTASGNAGIDCYIFLTEDRGETTYIHEFYEEEQPNGLWVVWTTGGSSIDLNHAPDSWRWRVNMYTEKIQYIGRTNPSSEKSITYYELVKQCG
jgi:hypothetical protein